MEPRSKLKIRHIKFIGIIQNTIDCLYIENTTHKKVQQNSFGTIRWIIYCVYNPKCLHKNQFGFVVIARHVLVDHIDKNDCDDSPNTHTHTSKQTKMKTFFLDFLCSNRIICQLYSSNYFCLFFK